MCVYTYMYTFNLLVELYIYIYIYIYKRSILLGIYCPMMLDHFVINIFFFHIFMAVLLQPIFSVIKLKLFFLDSDSLDFLGYSTNKFP